MKIKNKDSKKSSTRRKRIRQLSSEEIIRLAEGMEWKNKNYNDVFGSKEDLICTLTREVAEHEYPWYALYLYTINPTSVYESARKIWITSGHFDSGEKDGKRLEKLFLTAEKIVKEKWEKERKELERYKKEAFPTSKYLRDKATEYSRGLLEKL